MPLSALQFHTSTDRSVANDPLSEQFQSPPARPRIALGGARTPAPCVIDPPTCGASFRDADDDRLKLRASSPAEALAASLGGPFVDHLGCVQEGERALVKTQSALAEPLGRA